MRVTSYLIVVLVMALASAGCDASESTATGEDRLSVTSGQPTDPVIVDRGDASEQAIDMGISVERTLVILQFRAQLDAAIGDLDGAFGDRLVLGSYVEGRPEYVIYVTKIATSDTEWLDAISAAGLGGTVTIEAAPGLAAPGGPCLDRSMTARGSSEIFVSSGGQEIAASLGSISIRYCPGDPRYGQHGLEGDGFYATLDESTLTVVPGAVVAVSAPGMPGATLAASLETADEYPGDPGGRAWELIAPTDPGTYEVLLEPEWAEGNGRFKFNLVVEGQ